jgi:hypothetical protein
MVTSSTWCDVTLFGMKYSQIYGFCSTWIILYNLICQKTPKKAIMNYSVKNIIHTFWRTIFIQIPWTLFSKFLVWKYQMNIIVEDCLG